MMAYSREYKAVERSITQAEKMGGEKAPPNEGDGDFKPVRNMDEIRFVDITVYTVELDNTNKIADVINHSNNSVSDEEIKQIATTMISQSFQQSIGNLYFADYSYSYQPYRSITVVDNSSTKQELRNILFHGT
jgi:hypothetical protein